MSLVGKLVQDVDPPPLLYTVEEAAAVLRIGRTLAYALARRYEASGGTAGLPLVRVGNKLRVPRWALFELAVNGRVVNLFDLARAEADPTAPPNDKRSRDATVNPTVEHATRVKRRRAPRSLIAVEQLQLPSLD